MFPRAIPLGAIQLFANGWKEGAVVEVSGKRVGGGLDFVGGHRVFIGAGAMLKKLPET